eukprot:s483_g3.t1
MALGSSQFCPSCLLPLLLPSCFHTPELQLMYSLRIVLLQDAAQRFYCCKEAFKSQFQTIWGCLRCLKIWRPKKRLIMAHRHFSAIIEHDLQYQKSLLMH